MFFSGLKQKFFLRFNILRFNKKGIVYGHNCRVFNEIFLHKGAGAIIEIGNDFQCKSGDGLNPLSRNLKSSIYVENNARLIIGDNVGVSSLCIWSSDFVKIDNNVLIGADACIIDSDCHSLDHELRRIPQKDQANKVNKGITIGDDVFIGMKSLILKGVTLGDRCVVAAGSVVTKSFPSDCIIGGNPAKIIRKC